MRAVKRLGLQAKIGIGVAVLVAAISLCLAWLTARMARDALVTEAKKRGQILVSSLASGGVEPLLSGDFLRLKDLVDDALELDNDVVYAFYLDNDVNVLAHTFEGGFPVELISTPGMESEKSRVRLIDSGKEVILDFGVPITLAGDNLGTARVGISRDRFMASVHSLTTAIISVSLVVLVFGVSAGQILSRGLTRRLTALRLRAAHLATEHLSQTPEGGRTVQAGLTGLVQSDCSQAGDEVDQLACTFERLSEALIARLAAIKEYQEQLIQAQKMESLGKLAGGVAHEINTPLGIILGYAQLLREDEKPGSQIFEDLGTIEAQAKICRKIVADLLGFSRRSQSCIQESELNQSLSEAVALMRHRLQLEQVDITQDLDYTMPLIPADVERLRQVWLNLIDNASDSVGQGGKVVVASRLDSQAGLAKVFVVDDGPGIEAENLSRIFDPFFSTKSVGEGTGLGLSVSFGIVDDHQGRIYALSPVPEHLRGLFGSAGKMRGPGAAFVIELPLTCS